MKKLLLIVVLVMPFVGSCSSSKTEEQPVLYGMYRPLGPIPQTSFQSVNSTNGSPYMNRESFYILSEVPAYASGYQSAYPYAANVPTANLSVLRWNGSGYTRTTVAQNPINMFQFINNSQFTFVSPTDRQTYSGLKIGDRNQIAVTAPEALPYFDTAATPAGYSFNNQNINSSGYNSFGNPGYSYSYR